MSNNFRISLGNPIAREYSGSDKRILEMNKLVAEKISTLKLLSFEQLGSLEDEESETRNILGKEVYITQFKDSVVSTGDLVVVVQAFFPTFVFPNHISFSGTGRISVDGILVSKSGDISPLPKDELYPYS